MTEVDSFLTAASELETPLIDLRQLALALPEIEPVVSKESSVAPSPADTANIREKMLKVSEKALREIEDIKRIRRLDDGLFEMEPVRVSAVCDEVKLEVENLLANGRKIETTYSSRTRLVFSNAELLKSIIYNFLTDATLYDSADYEKSKIEVSEQKGKVRLKIRDYGPALPIALWRDLKSGNFDAPKNVPMRPGTSGLSLYISARFARYLNADVGAIRHKDGASFYIDLPVSRQMSLFEL